MASNIDPEKLAAFEALLRKEQERRFNENFNEKLAKGGCVISGAPREGIAPDTQGPRAQAHLQSRLEGQAAPRAGRDSREHPG
jgi:hypothetical protein